PVPVPSSLFPLPPLPPPPTLFPYTTLFRSPDLNFVIEYKPREPRVHMSFDSVARTLLGIEKIGLPNVGILLDFGHSLFGGESPRSEEHTSELQSRFDLVCRLLLEKKKNTTM